MALIAANIYFMLVFSSLALLSSLTRDLLTFPGGRTRSASVGAAKFRDAILDHRPFGPTINRGVVGQPIWTVSIETEPPSTPSTGKLTRSSSLRTAFT